MTTLESLNPKKTYVVVCYSKTGNSKFIGEKLAQELACDVKDVVPLWNNVAVLFLMSLMRINVPTNISRKDLSTYDEIVILGPIWGGLLISPLRTVLRTASAASKNIHFAVTCETTDDDRNTAYGYAQVLRMAGALGGKHVLQTEAFSTSLVNVDNEPVKLSVSEKIKITDANYTGIIKARVESFAKRITATGSGTEAGERPS